MKAFMLFLAILLLATANIGFEDGLLSLQGLDSFPETVFHNLSGLARFCVGERIEENGAEKRCRQSEGGELSIRFVLWLGEQPVLDVVTELRDFLKRALD